MLQINFDLLSYLYYILKKKIIYLKNLINELIKIFNFFKINYHFKAINFVILIKQYDFIFIKYLQITFN